MLYYNHFRYNILPMEKTSESKVHSIRSRSQSVPIHTFQSHLTFLSTEKQQFTSGKRYYSERLAFMLKNRVQENIINPT